MPFSDIEKEDFNNYDRLFSESVEIANIDTISKAEPYLDEFQVAEPEEEQEQLIFSETIAIQTNQVPSEPRAPHIVSDLEPKVVLFYFKSFLIIYY